MPAAHRPIKRRALCLHGWRANPELMELQMVRLQMKLDDDVEFSFLPGPIAVPHAADDMVRELARPPYFEWWDKEKRDTSAAIGYVASHIQRRGPFDLLVGFSQGAAMVTALLAEAAGEAAGEASCRGGLPALLAPLQHVLLVCGVPPNRRPASGAAATGKGSTPAPPAPPIRVPSLHVIGATDGVREESVELAWRWYEGGAAALDEEARAAAGGAPKARVLYHGGGHAFPGDPGPVVEALRAAMASWPPPVATWPPPRQEGTGGGSGEAAAVAAAVSDRPGGRCGPLGAGRCVLQ